MLQVIFVLLFLLRPLLINVLIILFLVSWKKKHEGKQTNFSTKNTEPNLNGIVVVTLGIMDMEESVLSVQKRYLSFIPFTLLVMFTYLKSVFVTGLPYHRAGFLHSISQICCPLRLILFHVLHILFLLLLLFCMFFCVFVYFISLTL